MLTRILSEYCLLVKDRPLLVGVSGGPDSLYLLYRLREFGYLPIAAHFNHGLRPEADAEAEKVAEITRHWKLPYRYAFSDVKKIASMQKLSIEEAAREARYRFLFGQAAEENAQAVAVGHNADDQAETLLLHLIQGTGLSGLRAMSFRSLPNSWSSNIPLVRPLLGTWRKEILIFLADQGLDPLHDQSNQDQSFLRNRIRLELLPLLEEYNPAVRQLLWQTTRVIGQDYALLDQLVDEAWEKALIESASDYLVFNLDSIKTQPPSMIRLLIRRAIAHLSPGHRSMSYKRTLQAQTFIQSASSGDSIDLVANLALQIEEGRIWVFNRNTKLPTLQWPQLEPGTEADLPVPGIFKLNDSWIIESKIMPLDPASKQIATTNVDPFQAWFDPEKVDLPLTVRTRRPGDRIQLLGMQGASTKISDLMINLKMPVRARPGWPIICAKTRTHQAENEIEPILWVPGYRVSEIGCLDSQSRLAIQLHVKPRSQ